LLRQRDIGRKSPVGYRCAMTYDDIRRYAELSVRRGCGFALMAIVTAMVGFSAEPWIAVRTGTVFVTIAAIVLFWRGRSARARNYRYTEVWLMIEDAPALPRDRLQTMIGGALAEVYFSHARVAAYMALAMCIIGLIVGGPSTSI
jgi:hypothetical protein